MTWLLNYIPVRQLSVFVIPGIVLLCFIPYVSYVRYIQYNSTLPDGHHDIISNISSGKAPARITLNETPEVTIYPLPGPYRQDASTDTFTDLLAAPHPQYLPNYRNPCWVEPLSPTDGTFPGNSWWDPRFYKIMAEAMDKLPDLFSKRREEGKMWKIRCLPYFYVAGVTKCGTSDLFDKLRLHPLITAAIKELHWWNKKRSNDRQGNFAPIAKYVDMMDMSAMKIENLTVSNGNGSESFHPMILGEGSPSYFWVTAFWRSLPDGTGLEDPRVQVARNIYHVTPMAKIILIFRNPINRAYSQYWYGANMSNSAEHFHKQVIENIHKITDCVKRNTEWFCVNELQGQAYVSLVIGMYVVFLEKWLEVFPRQQIFALCMEEYAAKTTSSLNDIFHFLGVGELPVSEIESWQELGIKNKHKPTPPMLEVTRQLLVDFYAPYNRRLSEILEDEKYLWKN